MSETIAGDAAGNYTIVRTFLQQTPVHFCDKTITVEDTTAPELSIPADYTAECSDRLILDDATASNCGEVTIEVSSETTQATVAQSARPGSARHSNAVFHDAQVTSFLVHGGRRVPR